MENVFLLALCGICIGGAWSFYQRHQRGWSITMLLIALFLGILWFQATNDDKDDQSGEASPDAIR